MSYTQVFGGTTIYPSDVSYLALTLSASTTLDWPLENDGGTPAARIIDVTPDAAGWAVSMPDATLTGAGQTVLFNNLSATDSFAVKDYAGGTLATVAPGEQWQIYLAATTTAAGTWRVFRYGASTATVQPSMLAGYGLTATGSTLSQQYAVTEINSNFTLGAVDRAATFVWTGGAGTITLPSAAVAANGWFINLRNSGSGSVTIDPVGSDLINGAASLVLQPEDSAVLVSDGVDWLTVGLGQAAVFAFDYTSIDLTGDSSPYTLAGAELNRVAYAFVGALTNDMEIVVPATIQQYWVENNTTGSYTLSVRAPAQVTGISVAQGARSILYCNGSDVVAADTGGIATPVAIVDGGTGATTAGAARVNLGGTALGIALFTAATTGDVWTALGAAPSGTVDGGSF